jgi:transposase InsO family protein
VTERGLSQRHACELVGIQRSSARYIRRGRSDEAATVALVREYAHEQPMYGYRIITAMLKHDGYRINRKRVYRIWRQEGLQLPRRKVMKRRYGDTTGTLRRASHPNEVWTYDFLEGRTERGGKLRMLTVLDEYTRECLTIHVARSISSRQVMGVLEWLFLLHGAPGHLRSDNGPEFIAYALQEWLRDRQCHTLYITPGSPWENPFIESFNGTFRSECLDRWLFTDGREAQIVIEQWRQEYNQRRPHSSLGYLPPAAFAEQVRLSLAVV